MKKALFILLSLAVAAFVYSAITSSAHDFSAAAWNSGGEICQPCHTPHNAKSGVSLAPLWNHSIQGVTTYTLYTGYDFQGDDGTYNYTQPDGSSKLCLSCHDGAIALDSFGIVAATGADVVGTNFITSHAEAARLVVGDSGTANTLEFDHPISFDYTAALATADGELYDPTTQSAGLVAAGTIDALLLDTNNKMQCASCHDVHDNGDDAGTKLLVKSNAASDLCLTCHNK